MIAGWRAHGSDVLSVVGCSSETPFVRYDDVQRQRSREPQRALSAIGHHRRCIPAATTCLNSCNVLQVLYV